MIAAINGTAAGAGFALSLCCDMRVGCDASAFKESFGAVNLPPEAGMSFLLSRIVGLGRAMDICLTGVYPPTPGRLVGVEVGWWNWGFSQ